MEQTKRNTVERRSLIIEKLEGSGQVFVNDLSEQFNVSEVTIRNDLLQLEKKHMLIRARGGAIKTNRVSIDYELSKKQKLNLEQKLRIGKKAASLIEDGDTVIIDSGTTTMEMTKNISPESHITVITNALNIANYLSRSQHKEVIIPGGFLRKESLSLVGTPAEKNFKSYMSDKLFLGVDGFDIEFGLMTPNIEEAHLNQAMIGISRQVIVLADSSKIFKRSLAVICPISKIHILVTDDGIPPNYKANLEKLGIEVIIA
ncbi:MAG: DeoR/GlpR transcriptional regulator [Cyclobacteriaceae bacterium]|nr:DeoR/GlpR transcriptional regulator [Cyclobacteriaceae bacterium]